MKNERLISAGALSSAEDAIYKKAFEIAVRCARELNGTPELKAAYEDAQKDNRALKSFMDFCVEKAGEEMLGHTVDAVTVVHGRLVDGECTNCGWFGDCCDTPHYNFCPNCGAKMDGERKAT